MRILVTGASSGIGEALIHECLSKGYEVIGVARSEQKLSAMELELSHRAFRWHACDVTEERQLRTLAALWRDEGRMPDAAICAAGIFPDDIHPEFTMASFESVIRTNLFGVMNVISALLPEFRKKNNGQFIAVGSMAVYRGSARGAGYPASKAALLTAMKSLHLRYQGNGICFHTAVLGPIATRMWEGRVTSLIPSPQKAAQHIVRQIGTKKTISYFPFLSTRIYRMSLCIPDSLFVFLSKKLLK